MKKIIDWESLDTRIVAEAGDGLRNLQNDKSLKTVSGYSDEKNFSRMFKRYVGVSPHEFRVSPPESR